MKKILSIIAIAMTFSLMSFAQEEEPEEAQPFSGVNGIVKKEHIVNKKYIPYAYVREADVLWSKVVWRMIDMREKINLPMYYPTEPIGDRRNLITVILDAILAGDIVAYDAYQKDEFSLRLTTEEVKKNMGAEKGDTTWVVNPETGLSEARVPESDMDIASIKKVLLKEVWYFDKKYSRMDVRIIGICPIREAYGESGTELMQSLAFWVYYPSLRPYLSKQEVYNTKNDAQHDSYDDLFAKRRFGSFIFSEANVYDNRRIIEYNAGMETTLESERIKNDLFLKEHDMWEY